MYHIRQRMIPSFFPAGMVDQIFNCGKTIHFIRDSLQDAKWSVKGADESILSRCTLQEVGVGQPNYL